MRTIDPKETAPPMERRRKPLHVFQFIAALALFPLAVWFYLNADYLGVALALVIGVMVLAYTAVNLFGRPWP
jgi:hypothetical protein